jgi:peptide-methionine (S)-S-oxide reductase
MEEFEAKYPLLEDFVSSTAVARVNGYLGGNGSCRELRSEIVTFGLSKAGEKILLENVCGGNTGMSCSTKKCS